MYLGGGYHGQRLNKLYRSSIKEQEILAILKPMFKRYALEREDGERFGDFCIRSGFIKATREGKDFHDDVSSFFFQLLASFGFLFSFSSSFPSLSFLSLP